MLPKVDGKLILSVAGMALSIASAVVGNIASQKTMKEEVAKEVAKALQK